MWRAILSCVACLLFFGAGCAPPLSPGVEFTGGLVYGKGYVRANPFDGGYRLKELKFDLVAPREAGALRPAVVLAHGPSFSTGTRSDPHLVAFADALAAAGYACFLIDYRLVGDSPPAPPGFDNPLLYQNALHAAFVDTKAAIRHVRANAAAYGVDPRRIAVMGVAPGAYAAVAAGVTEPDAFAQDSDEFPAPPENNPGIDPRPQAVIAFWGNGAYVLDAFGPGDPPLMIVHGEADTTDGAPFSGAVAMRDACIAHSVPYGFFPLPGEGHDPWDARIDGKTLAETAIEFLDAYLP